MNFTHDTISIVIGGTSGIGKAVAVRPADKVGTADEHNSNTQLPVAQPV